MNKQHFFMLASVVLLISNLLLVGMIWLRPGHKPHPDQNKKRIIEQLHFDAQQQEMYGKTVTEHRRLMHQNERELMQLRQLLYAQLKEEQPLSIDSITDCIATKGREMERINVNHFLEIKQICRPDQLQYFNDLSEQLAAMFHHKPRPR